MFGLFSGLSLLARVGIIVGMIAAAGISYVVWRTIIFNQGAAYERAEQDKVDNEAVDRSREGRRTVRDCYDAGGMWDQSRGVCH